MSKYLDSVGLEELWGIIKSTFAASLSINDKTLTLKSGKGESLSSLSLPYSGIYFVKGTQTAATGAWKGNLPEVESLYDGLTIAYFLPYAGSGDATLTLTLKDSTTKAEPVYYNNSSRATTHYGAGATVVLTWISNATSGYSAVGTATGRWTRADYNSNTYTSAVCTTAAGTAAKTATCTDYALLNNSYVHVLIKNSNTIKSALTLNINSKGAKPIYINGTASSASNYTLPAGTYIVFYDGTNYYFNTNGNLPGHIDVNTISGVLGVAKGGTGKDTLDSGKALIGNGTDSVTLRDIYTRTDQGSIEWSSATNEYLITKGALAYWNGAYGTGGTSNIKKLGTIDTGVWQGTKIGVAYGGTGLTASPSMLTNLGSTSAANVFQASPRPGVTGTLGVGNGGTGQTSAKNASNAFINALDTETTALQDGDYFIAQTAGGGTTTTTYKRKALSTLSDYIEGKIGSNYLPLAGGQMTGILSWKNGTALPAKTSDINYLLTIDSFSDGGTTKYATIANVANAIAPTVETAIENDYTFLTKKTDWEIPEEADLNTYTTPGIYICRNKSRATTLSNSPCQRGFSLIVLANLLNDDGSISGVIQIVRMFTSHANSLPNQPVYTWQRKLYQNTWSNWVCTSATTAPVYPDMGTDSTSQFTDINFEAAKYGLGSMFHFSSVNGTTTVGNPRASANVLQMNYVTATGYDSQLALGSQGKWLALRGQYQGRWSAWNYVQTLNFGVCSTAADVTAKTVTLNSHVSATTGTEVTILFTNGNQATEPKLTINLPEMTDSTGTTYTGGTCGSNVSIYYQGKPVDPDYIKPGDVVRMIYYSSKWYIVGSINSVTSYSNHIRYYIDRTNGSDTNDGLTTSTPFKTIEKFLEITANAGYTDCRCTILKDGAYVLNKQALNNVTLHIKVDSSVNGNVILQGNYNVPEDWIMYNAHVKLTGTANAPIVYEPYSTQGIYFENSAVTLDYVKFNCRMQCFGCYVKADNVTAERLHLSGCTGYLATVSITNTNHEQHGIVLDRGCNMRISGTLTINALTTDVPSDTTYKDKNYFMNIQDSDIVLQSSFPATLVNGSSTIDITNDTNRARYSYAYGMRLSNAEITGTRIRLASYVSRGVNKTMLADEESDINVTWGGKKTGGEYDGRAGFTSLYGYETVTFTTPASEVSATSIKTWIIAKSTIDAAIQAAHPNVGTSSYPYDVVAVVPVSTSDNKIVFKDTEYIPTSDATNPGAIRVIVRNVTSTAIPAPSSTNPGATATVNVIYTMKPFSVTYKS